MRGAIYGMVTDMLQHASAMLARKIEEGKLSSGFTVRDVYRKDWSLLNSKEIIRSACDELVEAGWLRQEEKQGNVGRPKQAAFLVNPKIKIKKSDTENSPETGGQVTDKTDEMIMSV